MKDNDSQMIFEAYDQKDPEDFRMSEDDFIEAEKKLKGTRLSQFIKS